MKTDIPYKKTIAVLVILILSLLALFLVAELVDELVYDVDDGYRQQSGDVPAVASYTYEGVVWEDIPVRAVPQPILDQVNVPIISAERFTRNGQVLYELYTIPPRDVYYTPDGQVVRD